MINCIFVGIGGFIGAVLRYLISLLPIKNPASFPTNTLIINIVGALAIGFIAYATSKNQSIDSRLLLFLKVGICGGFTTFSTFSLEAYNLFVSGSKILAVCYAVLSAVCCIIGVWLGITLSTAVVKD